MLPPLHTVGRPGRTQPFSAFCHALTSPLPHDRSLFYLASSLTPSIPLALSPSFQQLLADFPDSGMYDLWPGRVAIIADAATAVQLQARLLEDEALSLTALCLLPLPAHTAPDCHRLLVACERALVSLAARDLRSTELPYSQLEEAEPCDTTHQMVHQLQSLAAILERVQNEAAADVLTGLPNSLMMQRYLQAAVEEGQPFALLLVDGDNLATLKQQSYAQGDAILRHLAALLYSHLDNDAEIARWRLGDEFMILLRTASVTHAMEVADRIVRGVRGHPWPMPLTVSVGVALYPLHGTCSDVLVSAAESAMKQAKQWGKDRAVAAQQMDSLQLAV